jgi:hypothetical protein
VLQALTGPVAGGAERKLLGYTSLAGIFVCAAVALGSVLFGPPHGEDALKFTFGAAVCAAFGAAGLFAAALPDRPRLAVFAQVGVLASVVAAAVLLLIIVHPAAVSQTLLKVVVVSAAVSVYVGASCLLFSHARPQDTSLITAVMYTTVAAGLLGAARRSAAWTFCFPHTRRPWPGI